NLGRRGGSGSRPGARHSGKRPHPLHARLQGRRGIVPGKAQACLAQQAGLIDLMLTIDHHDTTVRVRYAQTDQMGVVYHANYLIWFEVGRVELMRALGIEYKRMEIEDDCHIVVADVRCRYHSPALYDEVIRVRTRIAE